MAVVGAIPEQVVIALKPEERVSQAYTGKKFKVRPAFIVDANSERLVVSAKNWATGDRTIYRAGMYQPNPDFVEPDVIENVANAPIIQLRILGVEHRGEGGLAYKVATPEGYYVDLREAEFMEAVFEDRIRNGIITGEYVWARAGSQMRIVLVGSDRYTALLAAGKRAAKGKIPALKLVVGNAYRGKGQSRSVEVFLGRVRRTDDPKFGKKKLFAWTSIWGWENGDRKSWKRVTITQSSSMVEDLGPSGSDSGGSRRIRGRLWDRDPKFSRGVALMPDYIKEFKDGVAAGLQSCADLGVGTAFRCSRPKAHEGVHVALEEDLSGVAMEWGVQDLKNRVFDRLLRDIRDPRREVLRAIYTDHRDIFHHAQGSGHNHQAWPGGYADHIAEVLRINTATYQVLNAMRPLPFTEASAAIVLFFHDFEKPFRYGPMDHSKCVKWRSWQNQIPSRTWEHAKWSIIEEFMMYYEFELTVEERNALLYTHGEGNHHKKTERVAGPLAAHVHHCDNISARIWFDEGRMLS
jgi:hypothetical protein